MAHFLTVSHFGPDGGHFALHELEISDVRAFLDEGLENEVAEAVLGGVVEEGLGTLEELNHHFVEMVGV